MSAPAAVSPFAASDLAATLFEESGDAMFLVDPDADALLDANRTAVRLTGFTKAELGAAPATSLFRFHAPGGGARAAKAAAQKTTVFHARDGYQLRTKADPGWRPVTLTVTRLHFRAQTLALFTARDDTDRLAALEAVRRSEERFRALVEKSTDGIIVLTGPGAVAYASPAIGRILGLRPAEVEGHPARELVHPEDVPAMEAAFEAAVAAPGEEVAAAFRAARGGGGWKPLDAVLVARLDDPSVRGVVVNVRDVSETVRAQNRINRQFELLRTILDAVPDPVCVKDRHLRVIGGNRAFATFAGRAIADLIGKPWRETLPAAWDAAVCGLEAVALATGLPERAEVHLTGADGRPRRFDLVAAPTRGADGEPAGLSLVGRDVTDRVRLEDDLRQAQKMEAVGRLAGGVAHDFNNLLTVILSNLEVAREQYPGGSLAELLATTDTAARRAADLTSQLLGFARRRPLAVGPVDANGIVREAAALLRRTVDPAVTIVEYLRPNLWPARADAGQVHQVIMNLCLNARDALPGGGTVSVTTGNYAGDPEPMVRIRVADTGTGMPDEVRKRVFEPFFTTKGPGSGTGLGLAVVFGIVQAHGGRIACDSQVGRGTIFEVFLPADPKPLAAAVPVAPPPVAAGRGERVLLAEDEPMIRTLAKKVLTGQGFAVTAVEDGQAAVEAFAAAPRGFDIAVLDLTMPRLSGRDALARIREMAPALPVILASGFSADRDRIDAGPGVTFLDKPYTPAGLGAAIRAALDAGAKKV